ncbi:MAG: hypothetical protein KCHDKBKB_03117 [Elusimicrobia bacterium]|nr:hypothetical protein [Elusimicrobiota bacterium]
MAAKIDHYPQRQSRATFQKVWERWRTAIRANSAAGQDNEGIVSALITVESAGDPAAVGDAGHAFGLMQITLPTARLPELDNVNVTKTQLLEPAININLGTRYLVYLYWLLTNYAARNGQQFSVADMWRLALASYNAGPIYAGAAMDLAAKNGKQNLTWGDIAEMWIKTGEANRAPPGQTFPAFAGKDAGKPLRKIPRLFVAPRAEYIFDMAREVSGLIPGAPPRPGAPAPPMTAPFAPAPQPGAPAPNPFSPPAAAPGMPVIPPGYQPPPPPEEKKTVNWPLLIGGGALAWMIFGGGGK